MRVSLGVLCTLLCCCLAPHAAFGQSFGIHYGPRSFTPAPLGTNAIDVKYEHLDTSIGNSGYVFQGFNIKTDTALISYTHYFNFFGKTAAVVASLPYVMLEGDLELSSGTIDVFDEGGITDPYFQFYTPLVGADGLELESFVRKEPGFIAGIFGAARPPIGEYDSSKPANPGSNRWELRVGMPIQYIIGLPTQQTTFEFVPVLYFFEDNGDTMGGDTVGQDPLLHLEAHITRDFNRMFWGSLNTLYAVGGKTTLNGAEQDDKLEYLGGGCTIGARLTRSIGANVSVGTDIWTKSDAAEGNWIRASITTTF